MKNSVGLAIAAALAAGPVVGAEQVTPSIPVATYSIVARDAETGQLGVAVQSHWFSVGSVVTWAEAGVGAIATQSFVNVDYGPLGLDLMRSGRTSQQALDGLLAGDPGAAVRQVAMVDAAGNVASHTGDRCIFAAGHQAGEGYSVQANIMVDEDVWPAMARAYEASLASGADLPERLLKALEAAEAAGGDQRGRQSAAILVVAGDRPQKSWGGRLIDLRVEDSPAPLVELRRLVELGRAYGHMNRGDLLLEEEKWEEAMEAYSSAARIAPQISEIPFWQAVTLLSAGREDEALSIFGNVFRTRPEWADLIPRLVPSELLPDDPALIEKILALDPRKKDTR